MVGSNSKVGILQYDEGSLAEVSEETFLEQRGMEGKPEVNTEIVQYHECGEECEQKYPIHMAARNGDLSKFKVALENKKKTQKHKEIDCQGHTVLHHIAGLDSPTCTEIFEHYHENYTSDLWDQIYLNARDPKGRTVLHLAVLASPPSTRLVEHFLRLGVDDTTVDEDGEIALACAVYGTCKESFAIVEILLNLLSEKDSDKYSSQILLNAVQANQYPELIELLLGRLKSKGIQAKTFDGGPGFTLLQNSVYWTLDDSPVQVECVKRLLAVLDKEDINAVCESESWRGKTVLQIAATENAFNVLNELIAHEFTDLFITDTKQRTILHTLADSGWSVAREQSLTAIFNSAKLGDKPTKTKFLDMKDDNGETALEIAIRRDSVPFSRAILVAYPEHPKHWLGEVLMRKIYEKVPEIMIPLMNSAIQFHKKNYEAGDELFESDLGPVIGYGLNDEAAEHLNYSYYSELEGKVFPGFKKETDYLSIILDSPHVKSDERAAVLCHPLVILFIHEKWKKLDELFWVSFGANMTLLWLYVLNIVHIFWLTCPYYQKEGPEICKITRWQKIVCTFMAVSQTTLFLNKLSVDFVTTRFRNIIKLENALQLLYTIGVMLITITIVTTSGINHWHHWLASNTVLLASFLAFSQLLKIPSLGIYADVFYKVLQKMIRLMITFCPLLIGFTVAVSLILPGNPKFSFLPFNFVKILVMMTGEINFDDVFYADYKTPFRVYAILLFALFTVIVSIVIFNLMLGFTISDIQTLENESELQILTSTLGQIVVFERLVFSKLAQKFVPKSLLRRYLVVMHKMDSTSSKDFYRVMDEIPSKLRKSIMELAKDQQRLQQQQHMANKTGNPKSE